MVAPSPESEFARAAAEAELADTGDRRRAARVTRAVVGLEGIGERIVAAATAATALAGGAGGVSFDALRRAANGLTTALSRDARGAGGVYQPHGDSPEQCASPFAASSHVRPRRAADYSRAEETVQPGQLAALNPRGLYEAHLPICGSCRRAEARGAIPPRCPLGADTICALAEGAWVEWGDGGPPPSVVKAEPPWREPQCSAGSPESRYFTETFDGLVAAGVLRRLSEAEAADPSLCAMIATVRAEPRAAASMTEEQREATRTRPGGLDIPRIASLAAAAGAAQFEAYARACGGSSSAAAMGAAEADRRFAEIRAPLPGAATKAPRLVTGLHRTVNLYSKPMSVEYATIASLMGGIMGDGPFELGVDDGEKAYNQVPIRSEYRRYFCIQHPVTLAVYRYERVCFGGSQSCTLYSAITALIKLILRAGPPRAGGDVAASTDEVAVSVDGARREAEAAVAAYGVAVTGLLDDIASAPCVAMAATHFAWVERVFSLVRFTISPSKRQRGPACLFLGGHCDTATRTATAKGEKLFTTYRDMAIMEAAISAARRRGASSARDGERVPFTFFESFVGSFEWLATFGSSLRLLRQGFRASLEASRRTGGCVALWPGAPCAPGVAEALGRARRGLARAVRYFPSAHARVITVQAMPGPAPAHGEDRALQGRVREVLQGSGPRVIGLAGDASLSESAPRGAGAGGTGARCWGVMLPAAADGRADVIFGQEEGDDWDSGSLELRPHLEALRRCAASWRNCVVVLLSDNIGNSYRLNKGNARFGTRAHRLLAEIYALVDAHDIELLALWLPRAANATLDALSKCRSYDEARAWASAAGCNLL